MYKVSNLSTEYQKKLITAEQAADMVQNGDRLHFGLGCGSIIDIDKAIAKRADELRDITVISTVSVREKPFETYLATKSNEQVRFESAHFNSHDRNMNRDGRCWYIPMMFCELPFFWVNNDCGIDIAMFQVAPMDEHGNFNLGPQVADMWGIIKSAKKNYRRGQSKYADRAWLSDPAQSLRHRLRRRRQQHAACGAADETAV